MALSNHVGHADQSFGSPGSRRGHRTLRSIPEIVEYAKSDLNRRTVKKTPSIIALENLTVHGCDEYTVESAIPPSRIDRRPLLAPPQKSYLPIRPHSQEERELTKVHIHVVILKIGEIETIKEFFEADVFIRAKWREPVLDKTTTTVSDFSQFWNPELVVQNVFEDPKERVWYQVEYSPGGQAFICEMRRIKGKFFETMELNDFPFDIQSISLIITSELNKNIVKLVEDPTEVSSIHVECFSDSQEWNLHDFVEIVPLDISAQYTRTGQSYSGLIVTSCVTRRPGFFAWNVLVIVNMLNVFAFTTFAVSPTLPQNRLQLSFILALAGISFRFVTNQSIPKISYLTHLDRYILISMLFSGLITFWHAILSRLSGNTQNDADFWAFIVFLVAYMVFQVAFVFIMIYQRQIKLKEVRGKEDKYKDKARSIMGNLWATLRKQFTEVAGVGSRYRRNRNSVAVRPR